MTRPRPTAAWLDNLRIGYGGENPRYKHAAIADLLAEIDALTAERALAVEREKIALAWVRNSREERDAATAHLRALVDALPRCGAWRDGRQCLKAAMRRDGDQEEVYCDEHAPTQEWDEVPWADALRAAAAWLAGRPRAGEETER